MFWDHIFDEDISPAGGDGSHVGAGLDLVRDDAVLGAVHFADAADLDDVGSGSADVGAHGVQEVCQVDNVGLLGRILNDGQASRLDSGQHDIHGGTDRDNIHVDGVAGKGVRLGVDNGVLLHVDRGTEGLKALQVLVDGTDAAEVAAARHGDPRLGVSAKQSSKQIIGCAEMFGELIRYGMRT